MSTPGRDNRRDFLSRVYVPLPGSAGCRARRLRDVGRHRLARRSRPKHLKPIREWCESNRAPIATQGTPHPHRAQTGSLPGCEVHADAAVCAKDRNPKAVNRYARGGLHDDTDRPVPLPATTRTRTKTPPTPRTNPKIRQHDVFPPRWRCGSGQPRKNGATPRAVADCLNRLVAALAHDHLLGLGHPRHRCDTGRRTESVEHQARTPEVRHVHSATVRRCHDGRRRTEDRIQASGVHRVPERSSNAAGDAGGASDRRRTQLTSCSSPCRATASGRISRLRPSRGRAVRDSAAPAT